MNSNILRYCGHSRLLFVYWLEKIYTGVLTKDQQKCIDGVKSNMCAWLITTSGYYDKSIEGNWRGSEKKPFPTDIKTINIKHVVESDLLKRFLKDYMDILMRRSNDIVRTYALSYKDYNDKLNKELDLFIKYIYHDKNNEEISQLRKLSYNCNTPNTIFSLCNNKNVLIINYFGHLVRDNYLSGRVRNWYIKFNTFRQCQIPNIKSISSIETPYPIGNGMNESVHNNFYEKLEHIKEMIDNHTEPYDIAIISAGIYTVFIADYIEKNKNKDFICIGRELSNTFLISYKGTFQWCACEFTKQHIGPYLCSIPDTYKINGYDFVENGCYW